MKKSVSDYIMKGRVMTKSISLMQFHSHLKYFLYFITRTLDLHLAYSLKVTSLSASPSLEISGNGMYHQKMPQPESCPELAEQNIDKLLNRSSAPKHSESELLPLRALSLIERVRNNRGIKFSATRSQNSSEKSTESSDNSSISYKQSEFLSPVSGDEQLVQINSDVREYLALESDDTSYAKAIRESQRSNKHNINGFSSSCEEEETDRYEHIAHSEGFQTLNYLIAFNDESPLVFFN